MLFAIYTNNNALKAGIPYNQSAFHYSEEGGEKSLVKVGLDFIAQERLRIIIENEIEAANRQLEDYETIKRHLIINRKFTGSTDELTPTLKLKRKSIARNFAVEIEKLYMDD